MFCALVAEASPSLLEALARACSPRVARHDRGVVFDVSGCARTIGPPDVIAREVASLAAARGVTARVAVAPTATAAWLLAHAGSGPAVALPDRHAAALAPLPLRLLDVVRDLDRTPDGEPRTANLEPRTSNSESRTSDVTDCLAIIERWGVKTLGGLAALPRPDIASRLGPIGVRLHQAASGEDARPFVPVEASRPFVERMTVEWPIEGLEPLAFVLARLFERLTLRLERADRGAIAIRTQLRLVTRETHERVLNLPSPIADGRILRTLVLIDLESHPPAAGIDEIDVHLDVAPGRIVIGSLIAASLPLAGDLATLVARLGALMGDTRVGAPMLVETYDARAVRMMPFTLPNDKKGKGQRGEGKGQRAEGKGKDQGKREEPALPVVRRLRLPIAARVMTEHGAPVRVTASARGVAGGAVVNRAGPWRTSGGWWTFGRGAWERDEWDVELADGGLYRVVRDRQRGCWEIEGVLD